MFDFLLHSRPYSNKICVCWREIPFIQVKMTFCQSVLSTRSEKREKKKTFTKSVRVHRKKQSTQNCSTCCEENLIWVGKFFFSIKQKKVITNVMKLGPIKTFNISFCQSNFFLKALSHFRSIAVEFNYFFFFLSSIIIRGKVFFSRKKRGTTYRNTKQLL